MTVAEETVIIALQAHACEPRRAGRAAWRAGCPDCGQPGTLTLSVGFGGLFISARCGCTRAEIFQALGIQEVER